MQPKWDDLYWRAVQNSGQFVDQAFNSTCADHLEARNKAKLANYTKAYKIFKPKERIDNETNKMG